MVKLLQMSNFTFYHKVFYAICVLKSFDPFPNTPFWDCPNFKKAAEDNWNVASEIF